MADANSTEQMTVIGADTTIKGEMTFEKSARILGKFEGRIAARGEVQIGSGADCRAAVEAESIVVDGEVHGPVLARERLTLNANARVEGDLTAGTLVVVEGASFVGHCRVGPEAAELSRGTEGRAAQPETRASEARAEPQTAPRPAAHTDIDFKPPWHNDTDEDAPTIESRSIESRSSIDAA